MYFCVYMYFKPSNYIIKKETEVTILHTCTQNAWVPTSVILEGSFKLLICVQHSMP